MLIALFGLGFGICIACVTHCAGLLHIQAVSAVQCVLSAPLSSRPVIVLTVFTLPSSLFSPSLFVEHVSADLRVVPLVLHCLPFVGVDTE
jgi:hypothetical protein